MNCGSLAGREDDLCQLVLGDDVWGSRFLGESRVQLEDDYGVVYLASAGSLTHGHTLLVTPHHDFSLHSYFGGAANMVTFLNSALVSLERIFGPGVIFEHGLSKRTKGRACGVVHSHAHFLPISDQTFPPALGLPGRHLDSVEYSEYLAWFNGDLRIAATDGVFESQSLRKLVAERLGTHDWNWREAPHSSSASWTNAELSQVARLGRGRRPVSRLDWVRDRGGIVTY